MSENINKLVSIVIPCYNHELYIEDCIKSVIDQTYKNIELIIIDDGSKDRSVEIINGITSLCKRRFIRFEFRSRSNKGLSATLNEALEWCEGEYLSCIASDDMMLPEKTSTQVEFLQKNKDITAVFGGVHLVDNYNNRIKDLKGTNHTYNFKDIILHKAVIYAPTQMIRTQLIRDVGGYNPDVIIEDWYMWLKLAQLGDLHCLPEYLSLYRYHENNISKQFDKMHEGRLQVLSFFSDEKFYNQAVKEVVWLNHLELFVNTNKNRISHLLHLFKNKPLKTIKLSFKKLYKKIEH
ncbi:glycosyltransferase [Psychrobacter sanguinis]|uniref:glycosyltransferase family 2 protein n=1 Tax=Psychrobacter sanguinis TaxID=861445 RepID=UPI002A74B628|nr:glycosyltransferase [Psychrobacter sanguinis]MDY3306095.1 glycosyltransferase [Psychrobacter sanguinis]